MKVIKPTTIPCLTLATVKAYLRIDHTADDDYIEDVLIPAAQDHIERMTGYLLSSGTVTIVYDEFSGEEGLPYGPGISITSVLDADSNSRTAAFELGTDDIQGPESGRITVTYVGGYTTTPAGLIDIVLSLCAHRYMNRGDNSIPALILRSIQPYMRLMPL